MSNTLLTVRGLNTYYGASHVLRDLDFTIERGQTVGLMGRNGMGNVAGALIGAFGFELFLHFFKDLPKVGEFDLGKHWQLWMGSLIVLVVLVAPQGLMGLLRPRSSSND